MTRLLATLALVAAIMGTGCGATRQAGNAVASAVAPTLTSASATFTTLNDGKDRDTAVTLQLLRSNAELGAELRHTGTEFDDNTTSAPMALTLSSPFRTTDLDSGEVRVRMAPDGQDDWNFNLRLSLQFSDGTTRNFLWNGVVLNNANPERVLTLAGARVP
jgi:hypothetical protein